jgi:hypothetical protein
MEFVADFGTMKARIEVSESTGANGRIFTFERNTPEESIALVIGSLEHLNPRVCIVTSLPKKRSLSVNLATRYNVLEVTTLSIYQGWIDMNININIPASVLEQIDIQVEKPVGRMRLQVEDDWLVVKGLASTIKCRPRVETGQIILQNIEVSGLLWPVKSMIVKYLEENAKKIAVPNLSMSIKDKKIEIVSGVDFELPPFLQKFIDKSPPA